MSKNPDPDPIDGNQPRRTENTQISTIAATKDGVPTATEVATSMPESAGPPGRRAESQPEPTPRTTTRTAAIPISISVPGSRAVIRPRTGARYWMEVPKSPCAICVSQRQYCTGNGSSRW